MPSSNSQSQSYPLEHYDRTMRWHDELSRRFTKRSLDIPDDEMNNVGNKTGMGWKELAVIGALILGGGALSAHFLGDKAAPPAVVAPVDSEYEVRFFDADGNPIKVPHVSEAPE